MLDPHGSHDVRAHADGDVDLHPIMDPPFDATFLIVPLRATARVEPSRIDGECCFQVPQWVTTLSNQRVQDRRQLGVLQVSADRTAMDWAADVPLAVSVFQCRLEPTSAECADRKSGG